MNSVNHPEFIPDSKIAKITAFWFKQIKADFYWLSTIQYIGSNAVSAEYKKYLYKMINLITDLSPDFEKPYTIGESLLPDYNYRYERWTENEKNVNLNILQGEQIGLKWMKQFCDMKKIDLIEKENNLLKIGKDEKYKNPCRSYNIPFNLAYIKFFYQNDWKNASKYYKITSAIDDSPRWSSILAAIMLWKSGNREKSIMMFLNMIDEKNLKKEEKIFYNYFNNIIVWILKWKFALNKTNLKNLNDTLAKAFPKENEDENTLQEDGLKEYLRKAVRWMNLYYIEKANKKYLKDTWKNAESARVLYDKKYIDYFPIDFQQYDDYGIWYVFDEKIWHFDKKVQNYTDPYFKWILKAKKK